MDGRVGEVDGGLVEALFFVFRPNILCFQNTVLKYLHFNP
ncbi:hypothetical protein C943_04038 [Mariniradius saccharolyticus AK6]|uniref:Uncharacterized protein n=1 Tax=Mariniradius saccharolyticus AK6 TaxID=1239962 RepID=M7X9W6_9BACT|nr:hypothetical protein C943_04038 [Mariniradius saccharolyticus AK6]